MSAQQQVLAAAQRLAATQPIESISLADVAREAGVSWPTVRRHIGGKARLRELLNAEHGETVAPPQDTAGRILAAAAHVFARHGYNGATLDDVAAEAGLTKGALYWHFASKNDLFLALMEDNIRRQVEQLPAIVAQMRDVESLTAILQSSLIACIDQQDWPRLMMEFATFSRDPVASKRMRELSRLSDDVGAQATSQAQHDGRVANNLDPRAVQLLFTAVIRGLLMTWLINPEPQEATDLIPLLARVIWQGIAPAQSAK